MTTKMLIPDRRPSYLGGETEWLVDFRRQRELVVEAREERKRLDVAEHTSEQNVPGARIRAWELVHGLRMPSNPVRSILGQIAATTQLSLANVHEEQRARLDATIG